MSERSCLNCSRIANVTFTDGLCHRYTAFENANVPRLFIVLNSTVNTILMILSILGNSVVITAVWKTPSLRYPSILLLCGLALSDIAVGSIVEPLFIAVELLKMYGYPKGDCRLETTFFIIAFVLCGVSFANVTLTSLDRYLAIQFPLRYDTIVTIPRVYALIILCWVGSTFCATLLLWNTTVFSYAVAVAMAVFISTCSTIYIKIYRVVLRHRNEIQAQEQAVYVTNELNMARLKKCCINSFFVYYFLLLCYLPLFIAWILSIVSENDINSPVLWKLANTAAYLNSALNPFLYCWRLPAIREPVMISLRKCFFPN